jgi:hypothetical protein
MAANLASNAGDALVVGSGFRGRPSRSRRTALGGAAQRQDLKCEVGEFFDRAPYYIARGYEAEAASASRMA